MWVETFTGLPPDQFRRLLKTVRARGGAAGSSVSAAAGRAGAAGGGLLPYEPALGCAPRRRASAGRSAATAGADTAAPSNGSGLDAGALWWGGGAGVMALHRPSTATVFVLTGGQVLWAVSSSFVVADAGLVLSSASPCRPVQDVVDRRGLPVGEASDQASDLGEAEVDELGGSVSAFSVSSSRARRTVRQAWTAMDSVTWRCQPG